MRTATSAGLGFQLSGEDYRNRGDEARSKVPDEEVQKAELLKSLVVLSISGNYLSILHSFESSFGPSFGQSAVLRIFDLIGDYSLVFRDFWVFGLILGRVLTSFWRRLLRLRSAHGLARVIAQHGAWYTSLVTSTPVL
jgi:hypothetical protein